MLALILYNRIKTCCHSSARDPIVMNRFMPGQRLLIGVIYTSRHNFTIRNEKETADRLQSLPAFSRNHMEALVTINMVACL